MRTIKISFLIALAVMLADCTSRRANPTAGAGIPDAPDYADTSQWYISHRDAPVDVFYIISTETGDYPLSDGTICHYADTYNDSTRLPLYGEMLGVDTLLSGTLNYYAPYYRQCSLQSFTTDSIARARFPLALDDVRRAFRHYLDRLNGGRPFVIAGFSQGAMIMLELLKEMDGPTYERMVAAYAIGIPITGQMLAGNKHIVAARAADDTGVTVCYNSVRDASCARGERSAIAINPVNWTTDGTPARLITEPTPLQPVAEQRPDTLTVCLDTASNLLFVGVYTATDYVMPLIGQEGNYHSREIWLYRQQLRDNIALRVECFLKKYKSTY